MAGIRSVSRLFTVRSLSNVLRRGYADEMSFTFASGNSVRLKYTFYKNSEIAVFIILGVL